MVTGGGYTCQYHWYSLITIDETTGMAPQAAGIIAGTTGKRFTRFVALTTLGAVLWVGTWASVGYLAGDHITVIYREVTRYSQFVLIALALLAIGLIARYFVRRRRQQV